MGGEGSIMHMIVSYRNNTALIRKKRLFKGGKSYFRAKEAYRKAAGGELAFRTATPHERAIIRSKIKKEYRREKIIIALIALLIFSIAIWLTVQFWPLNPAPKKIHSITITTSDFIEFNKYMDEGDKWMEKNKWFNAIYEYDKGYTIILENHSSISQKGLRLEYQDRFENVNPSDVLSRVSDLIIKYPRRIELYKFRAEYLERTNMPHWAEPDYKKIEELMR